MDYKTGSYLIQGTKEHQCEFCKLPIRTDGKHFARVEEYGEKKLNANQEAYRLKNYFRYHIFCACRLKDITQKEMDIINKL